MEIHRKKIICLLTIIVLLLGACASAATEPSTVTTGEVIDTKVLVGSDVASLSLVTVQTAAGPVQIKELMTCMAREPESLYLYAGNPRRDLGARSAAILHTALYEPMAVMVAGEYEARGLTHIPTPENGGVSIASVEVQLGDWVVDANGALVQVDTGTWLRSQEGKLFQFSGTAVSLPQMRVTFTMQPFVWSDGTAVTAADSVFSYEIAADPTTPVDKSRVQRTAAYVATGLHTVQWTGLPGYVPNDYVQHIWTPLPSHQLGGYSAAELLTLDLTTRMPLSYGRFALEAWEPGSHISLISNPHYYAADKSTLRQRLIYEFLESEANT